LDLRPLFSNRQLLLQFAIRRSLISTGFGLSRSQRILGILQLHSGGVQGLSVHLPLRL